MRVSKTFMMFAAAGMVACQAGGGPQMSHLVVRLADAPGPQVASAEVSISSVYLIGTDGSRFTITDDAGTFDLSDLQDSVTAFLGDLTIPAGDYAQLRMVVTSATITLDNGLLFSNGSPTLTLKVPSGPQTGIKVEFGGPIHVAPGETDLVVDFDVLRSFVFLGTADNPTGAIFKPVLHGVVTDQMGSISGTSSPADQLGVVMAINSTTDDTVATAEADATTGAYTLMFLPPGDYTVLDSSSVSGNKAPTQAVHVDPGQDVTGIDFTLP